MEAMINVGANSETVEEVGKVILKIISGNCGEQAKVEALLAFKKICNVSDVTIQDCTLYGEYKELKKSKPKSKSKGRKK